MGRRSPEHWLTMRAGPAHVEASLAELAVHASFPQLRRTLSRYSFDPPGAPTQLSMSHHEGAGSPRGSAPRPTWAGWPRPR
jgi:hypothetical protein